MASDLVAKLGVDSSGWDTGFQKARGTLGSFSGGIAGLFSPAGLAMAGVAAGAAVGAGAIAIAGKGLHDFNESLMSSRKLASVLEATGGAAGLSADEISGFAAEMQTLTNFEDDATVASAAVLAAFTNIGGEQFKGTLSAAMDLTTIMGGELKDNVKLLGKAINDPVEGMAKLARSGVVFSEAEQQKIAALQKSGDMIGAQQAMLAGLESRFGGAAKAVADPWTQFTNVLGDVSEMLGSAILPGFNVVMTAATELLGPVLDLSDEFSAFGIESAVVLENLGTYTQLAATNFALFAVGMGADIGHFFTETMPAYMNWFGENWQALFIDLGANTLTTFENLGTNIANAWTAVLNFFSTGKLEFNWTPLTQGFIKTVKDLPDIPKRALTELEKDLAGTAVTLSVDLAENTAASREKFTKMYSPSGKTIPSGGLGDDDDADGKKAKQQKLADNNAALSGSSEAAKLMLKGINASYASSSVAMKNGNDKEKDKENEQRQESMTYLQQISEHTGKMADEGAMLVAGDF